ncbi:MAG: tRNA glutamyl-Q(34) synthetase GluQRS [Rhodobacteraceae bacterium]|nr:tRNA glutamyl-Q(34) synthetase GluQRS [Paracoccaceae bacterium]
MTFDRSPVPVFRFAPSPNGLLHAGHAFSAHLNFEAARGLEGRFLLRMEDIDQIRCTSDLEAQMVEDLQWLGLSWEMPVLRQSERFDVYRQALKKLDELGVLYRGYLSRGDIRKFVADFEVDGAVWPRDPDGAPIYPGDARVLSAQELEKRRAGDGPYSLRLNMKAALELIEDRQPLSWWEGKSECLTPESWLEGTRIVADPSVWGDVVLARKDTPTSYHLSVVVDDAAQGVSDVIRGKDLEPATSVHRLLQELLGLPEPRYRHHRLLLDEDGEKLSKSRASLSLKALREAGTSVDQLY